MKPLIKVNSLVFAFVFLEAAILEFIGWLGGRSWCGWAALVCALFSFVLFMDYHISKSTENEKENI